MIHTGNFIFFTRKNFGSHREISHLKFTILRGENRDDDLLRLVFFRRFARTLALKGMQVLAHPSNLVMPYCQNAMVTRCLENRIFAVTANRIGVEKRGEDDFTFTGASQITGHDGKVLSSAPVDRTHIATVEIDVKLADNKNINV